MAFTFLPTPNANGAETDDGALRQRVAVGVGGGPHGGDQPDGERQAGHTNRRTHPDRSSVLGGSQPIRTPNAFPEPRRTQGGPCLLPRAQVLRAALRSGAAVAREPPPFPAVFR